MCMDVLIYRNYKKSVWRLNCIPILRRKMKWIQQIHHQTLWCLSFMFFLELVKHQQTHTQTCCTLCKDSSKHPTNETLQLVQLNVPCVWRCLESPCCLRNILCRVKAWERCLTQPFKPEILDDLLEHQPVYFQLSSSKQTSKQLRCFYFLFLLQPTNGLQSLQQLNKYGTPSPFTLCKARISSACSDHCLGPSAIWCPIYA